MQSQQMIHGTMLVEDMTEWKKFVFPVALSKSSLLNEVISSMTKTGDSEHLQELCAEHVCNHT